MAAFTGNPDLLISSLLRFARTKGDRAAAQAWLITTQNAFRTAWMGGDEYATNISTEGGATSWLREIPANLGDQFCEAALKVLDQEAASGIAGALQDSQIRAADFSHALSNQG